MKQLIKHAMFRLMPQYSTALFSARGRAHAQSQYQKWGCGEIVRAIVENYGDSVLYGPFAGLRLPPSTFVEHVAPYLLGTYERELHPTWRLIFAGKYQQILDIGAKFGYYAVGLALRFPESTIVAFDTDPWARATTREVARLNRVSESLNIEGYCSPSWLKANLTSNSLIISDCEGYESQLFSLPMPTAMESCTLVIETHDHEVPGVTEELVQRFALTHEITTIPSEHNPIASQLDLSFLSAEQRQLALSDIRPQQSWLFAVPRREIDSQVSAS